MKKFLPFVFPAIALLIVIFLGYRWYSSKVVRPEGKISNFGEGVQIENLSAAEMKALTLPTGGSVKDLKSIELKGEGEVSGQVRYQLKDGRLEFSVIATLPELKTGYYQVWLKQVSGDAKRKAFTLEFTKSGHIGSAAVPTELMPFEVIVSQELHQDDSLEKIVLQGTVVKE